MKKLIKISLLVSIIAFYITCRDESMSLSTDIIENPKVLDVSNSNNASDLIVLFRVKESNLTITTARVGLAKSSTYTSFTTEDAKSLSGASFAEINNIVPNKLISVRLPSSLLDIDGDPISHTTSYKVVYMFVAGGQILLDENTIEAKFGTAHFLDGRYTGTWNDNRYSNFPISATLGVNGEKLKGPFYYSGSFSSCCGGSNDGQISIELGSDGITLGAFVYDQFLESFQGQNCPGTYTGSCTLNSFSTLEISFTGNDCEGDHTGGKIVLSKQF